MTAFTQSKAMIDVHKGSTYMGQITPVAKKKSAELALAGKLRSQKSACYRAYCSSPEVLRKVFQGMV